MSLRRLIAGAIVTVLASGGWAQDAPPPATDTGGSAQAQGDARAAIEADTAALTDEELLDEPELDALVAPIALYPDALLTQVLVAATYPLDIVKADRFLADNPDLSDKERADRTETEDWDPSVQVLTGGFPTVVQRMADEVDWTEDLGDAMLAQTDDLLDAVQRMRARAEAAGNLESNDAQVVETAPDDSITIAPADPDVVYVPSYDATAAYQPATTTVPATVVTDTGMTTGDLLTTGAIAFGSALLVNEIFDDNDDDWDDYWHGSSSIDWDDDSIHPGRGGISAGGDVNIDVDRNRVRVGDRDGPIADRNGEWNPDPQRRDAARNKLAAKGDGAGAAQAREKLAARPGQNDARAKLEAAGPAHGITPSGRAGAKPSLAATGSRPAKQSALKPGGDGGKAAKAKARGAESRKADRSPVAAKARASGTGHAKAIAKPKQAKAPQRKPSAKSSALKKPSGGGKRAGAAKKRGGGHAGKAKRR